jgi:PTH1 family peptidyl-tRNA hydrolase
MKVVVGLGNPGRQYERTPHNVGFAVVDELARRAGGEWKPARRFKAELARVEGPSGPVLLVKPQTFMNLSGEAVGPVLRYHGAEPADVVLVLDDADLPEGRLRLRGAGGTGGHRGLESVLLALGTGDVARVRVGIGRREGSNGLVGHVLAPVTGDARERMMETVGRAADAVERLLGAGLQAAMNEFNTKAPVAEAEKEEKRN